MIAEAPPWALELDRRLAAIERHVRRLAEPVNLLTVEQAAKRCGKTPRAMEEFARRHLTDSRESFDRRPGVRRLIYADEIEVLLRERLKGLLRFRRECGRME